MNNFLEKWKTDKRYQTKIKLSLYTLFVVIVAIFAISSNNSSANLDSDNQENNSNNSETNLNNSNSKEEDNSSNEDNIIEVPDEYDYNITVTINNQIYRYHGTKDSVKTTITKEVGETITNYIYEDNYYVESDGVYTLTTKEDVYDKVNYNYLNLENINNYLRQGKIVDEEYHIYLKDIILGNESEEYIIISIKDEINIDYTNMIKYFNNEIEEYKVNIKIEERNEEVN